MPTQQNFGGRITHISPFAFSYLNNLRVIAIPNTVEKIDRDAFSDCINLKFVKLPCNLKSIKAFTFYGCKSLKTITIPDGVKGIGFAAFFGSGLKSIKIPSNVEFIGDVAFSNCKNLKELTLSNGLKCISTRAFADCPSLENVVIPDSVEGLDLGSVFYDGQWCSFAGCKNLKSVKLPERFLDGVFYPEDRQNVFRDCPKLEHIYVEKKSGEVIDCMQQNKSKPKGPDKTIV